MPDLEERKARIEAISEQMDQRPGHVESRLERLEAHLDTAVKDLRGEIAQLR